MSEVTVVRGWRFDGDVDGIVRDADGVWLGLAQGLGLGLGLRLCLRFRARSSHARREGLPGWGGGFGVCAWIWR